MLLAVLAVVALGLITGTPVARRAVALFYERTMGNKEHYVSCAGLPAAKEAEDALVNHPDAVDRIRQVNPGHTVIYADAGRCPGKADIVILFATLDDSRAIKRIIEGDTFFGVPYRMYNT
jgi:hypothetical protein